jgi:hypothetical protein
MGKMVTNKQKPYKTCFEFYKNLYGTPQPFTKDIEFKRRFSTLPIKFIDIWTISYQNQLQKKICTKE